jgi:hypothetical protein
LDVKIYKITKDKKELMETLHTAWWMKARITSSGLLRTTGRGIKIDSDSLQCAMVMKRPKKYSDQDQCYRQKQDLLNDQIITIHLCFDLEVNKNSLTVQTLE